MDRVRDKLDRRLDTAHTPGLDLEVMLPVRPAITVVNPVADNLKAELHMVIKDTEAMVKLHLTDSSSGKARSLLLVNVLPLLIVLLYLFSGSLQAGLQK